MGLLNTGVVMRNFKPTVIWFTGLPAAGKSTYAARLALALRDDGIKKVFILEGEWMREHVSSDLGFSPTDRAENVLRAVKIASFFLQMRCLVFVCLISPSEHHRQEARKFFGDHFFLVHVDALRSDCVDRDPKGLYQMALDGKIKDFTGIDAPYEPPANPDYRIETMRKTTIHEQTLWLIDALKERGILW